MTSKLLFVFKIALRVLIIYNAFIEEEVKRKHSVS